VTGLDNMNTPNQPIDLEHFQQQIGSISDQLGAAWSGDEEWASHRLGAIASNDKNRAIEELINRIYQDAVAKGGTALGSKDEIRSAALNARSALQTPSIRSTICRFLGPITGKGSREVAVELAKASIPLVVAGTLAVPASPLVWGLIGFAAARIGTVWLCGDDKT
jgi:hypothetical protein